MKSYKKKNHGAFTAAEVLIVLVAIGIIATLTVPNSMKSVRVKQRVAAYKLAYKTVEHATEGNLISELYKDKDVNTNLIEKNAQIIWEAINNTVVPQGYACTKIEESKPVKANELYGKATWNNKGVLATIGKGSKECSKNSGNSPWIILENGLAISIDAHTSAVPMHCNSVMEINEQETLGKAVEYSCAQIFVDVNGLNKGPNTSNSNSVFGNDAKVAVNLDTELDEVLQNDRFRIFVGYDGITAGPKAYTETGRIMYEENI